MSIWDYFTRRERKLEREVATYMDEWIACIRSFQDAWEAWLDRGPGEDFYGHVDTTQQAVSRADELRRKIERDVYSKALLPGCRDDIKDVLDGANSLLSVAERFLFSLGLPGMTLPEEIRPGMTGLADAVCACAEKVDGAVRASFIDRRKADEVLLLAEINALERESEHLERDLIREIFRMDLPTGDKLLLRDLTSQLASMCDLAEHVGDCLTLTSLKRLI